MVNRTARFLLAIAVAISAPGVEALGGGHDEPTDKNRDRVFRIHVVEEGTGRGVPLVELKTVNQIRYVTDSNGIVAFDEPGLFNRKVFFTVTSHGYEVDKDGFGFRGKALEVTAGGSADIVIRRLNVARRLYRVTGAGIYRDSVLTGDAVPIREPLLNGMVFGQDSVVNAVYQGKVHWFWGDTNRPDYPLGNFHVPGATSDLPGRGGLEPEIGVNLGYFVDDQGFARPTAAMPGEGPTWISGLVVLKDQQARERMFAVYAKIRKTLEVYERGLASSIRKRNASRRLPSFPQRRRFAGEFPDGHPFLHEDRGVEYIYYASPYPLVRVPAEPEHLKKAGSWEAFTCLKQGTRASQPQFDHGADGTLRYSWKTDTPLLRQDQQTKLIVARRIKPEEALLALARHRLGQGGGGARRLGVLERVPPALGDDLLLSLMAAPRTWARSGTPRPIHRSGPGSTLAKSSRMTSTVSTIPSSIRCLIRKAGGSFSSRELIPRHSRVTRIPRRVTTTIR